MLKKITFVTGNLEKLTEAKEILNDFEIENIKIDLPELQGERNAVIKEKAKIACQKIGKPCFVDDTSLCFNSLKGLPGIYVKHFLDNIGREGLFNMLLAYEDKSAQAVAAIAYCEPEKEPIVFEGITNGNIVKPRGDRFGWDPIFEPKGYNKTYAEMTKEEKNKISHRKKALNRLREYLENERSF